jgi:ribosomal protein RSM22 (predicted rRNA methylase)
LEQDGLIVIVEPALKDQSRKLLELRKLLIEEFRHRKTKTPYQVLTPCLGHQKCSALESENDWCHDSVAWWRPTYFKKCDELAGLDRKNLDFSFLVIARSKKTKEELLPALKNADRIHRVVSDASKEGPDWEFFVCGWDQKTRGRLNRKLNSEHPVRSIQRGDVLTHLTARGDTLHRRIETCRNVSEIATSENPTPDSTAF